MFPSTIASRLFRLGLLSVFCAGLFLSSGEMHIGSTGNMSIGDGGVYTVAAETAAPAGADAKTDKKEPVDDTINSIISFLNLGVGILTFLITPLIMLAGWLLSPDWTFGEVFWLRPILHQLWILISNVVYVIFGFFLVFIAFANIFGWESAKAYEMKTMLPKLVTGMLMVPFTWFIVSAVLSVSNVLTASVIQLPVATISKAGGDVNGLMTNKIIPKNITFNKDTNYGKDAGAGEGESKSTAAGTANGNFLASDCDKNPNDCLSIKEFLAGGGGGAYNLLSVYAYGIFRIQGYKSITTEQKINKIVDVASKLGFWVIFFLIFGVLVIAIVYALFSRAIMLWLYAMFSPLFALNYVMNFKGKLEKSVGRISITKFISLAMVPVYVSAALAFGLMFLGLVMSATGTAAGDNGSLKSSVVEITPNGSTTTFKFGGGDGITLTTIGLLDPESKSWVSKALDLGKGVIGTIIMNVLALVILWMAVMAALGADDITGAAVAPIQSFGDEIGKLAMKAPQYIPIPLWKDKNGEDRKISMAGLWSVSSQISQALTAQAWNQGAAIGKSFAEALWIKVSELWETLRKTSQDIKWEPTIQWQKEQWKKAFAGIWDAATLSSQQETILPQFKSMLKDTKGLSEGERDKLNKTLESGNLAEFIKQFEHILDKTYNASISEVAPENTDAYLKSIKEGTAATTPETPAWSAQKINVTQPSTTTPTQITVNAVNATITPKTDTANAKITAQAFKDLHAKLKEKDATVTEGDLEAELKKQNIDVSK